MEIWEWSGKRGGFENARKRKILTHYYIAQLLLMKLTIKNYIHSQDSPSTPRQPTINECLSIIRISYVFDQFCQQLHEDFRWRTRFPLPLMFLHQRYQIKLILIQSLMSSNIKNEETVSEYNPYIIAHRGYCSLFPENSLQSIEAAIHKCHYVEFDILLTKDNEIVIFHDRYLSKLTNVSAMGEFEARKSLFADDAQKQEEEKVDWWVKDFTKDQLKRLEISQKVSKRPQLRRLKFTIPTLDEAIEEILYVKQQHIQQNTSGFLIQIKCAQEHKEGDQRDTIFAQKLIKCLQNHGLATSQQCKQKNFPIILQSFNHNFLKMMNESQLQLPLVHLYDKVQITKEFLDTHMFPKSIGIAISIRHATKQIMELCASKNLSVFFWTMKDDQPEHLPPLTPTFKHAYDFLFSLRMNGIITEFPQKCEEYLSIFNAAQKAKLNS